MAPNRNGDEFVRGREPFVRYLAAQGGEARPAGLSRIIAEAGGVDGVAILVVDVINGFCRQGALASTRVDAIVGPVVELLERARQHDVRNVALVCDTHAREASEFAQFAPHCVGGTTEAQPVDELAALPDFGSFKLVRKNSVSPWSSPDDLEGWLAARRPGGASAVIVVGDCTDLCVYQAAVPLKLRANQDNRPLRVIVPRSCVDTYDLPLDMARQIGAPAHDGDLMHELFLYHMALHGVEVVSRIDD